MASTGARRARSAVIFDLDGTLTRPYLDFDKIRAEIGIESGPILEAIAKMDAPKQQRAEAVLLAHEQQAAENALLQDGAAETLHTLRERGFPVAILTRNARRWVNIVLQKFELTIDALRTRDDGTIKPSAEPILSLCAELETDPARSWMVGDHLFDIISGKEAGAKTVLFAGKDNPALANHPELRTEADHVIFELPDLLSLVE